MGSDQHDGQQTYSYDATGQQATASGTALSQSYDGDGVRVKKVESGATTYYLRSSVLGKQVISEINGNGTFKRGYVYLGGQMMAVQEGNQVSWVHQDPVTKSHRLTNSRGTVVSWVEFDPWGGKALGSTHSQTQPHRYTSYERDGNGSDEAMFRRYESKWQRFAQPDPYDGSYDLTDPQSFNRYSYVQSDPVNAVDPTGLMDDKCDPITGQGCEGGYWGVVRIGHRDPWAGEFWLRFAMNSRFRGFDGDRSARTPQANEQKEIPCLPSIFSWVGGLLGINPLIPLGSGANVTYQPTSQQRKGSPPIRSYYSPEFAWRLTDAVKELNALGIIPQINDAFRITADQAWYQQNGANGNLVAQGISNHQLGNAVDINGVNKTIKKVMKSHGLIWKGKADPPHFEIKTSGDRGGRAAAAERFYENCLK